MAGIVLTTDLSEVSTRAFAPTAAMARKLGLPITLLGVLEDVPFEPGGGGLMSSFPDRQKVLESWRVRLRELADELDHDDVKSEVLDSMDVPGAIADYAHENGAELIAMATHGRSGLGRLLLGSVAEAVLRHSRVPVILFPPPADE